MLVPEIHGPARCFRLRRLALVALAWIGFFGALSPLPAAPGLSPLLKKWAPYPAAGLSQTPVLPTANDRIFSPGSAGYAAQSGENVTYGLPGWTRDFGHRFHKGVDITPTRWHVSSEKVNVTYKDAATGLKYNRIESVRIPEDEVYAILDGVVVVDNTDPKRSGYGRYVMIEHRWADGTPFISMYAHLAESDVDLGEAVRKGQRIGIMGQTSSNAGGRQFLKAFPHTHFEIGRVIDGNFVNSKVCKSLRPPALGGKYDPRNIQPYQPIDFLISFHAQTYAQFSGKPNAPTPAPTAQPSPESAPPANRGASPPPSMNSVSSKSPWNGRPGAASPSPSAAPTPSPSPNAAPSSGSSPNPAPPGGSWNENEADPDSTVARAPSGRSNWSLSDSDSVDFNPILIDPR